MGIEAFGVSMHIVELKAWQKLNDLLAEYPSMRIKSTEAVGAFETVFGEYGDGAHFMDVQISREIAKDKCVLAIRFSLCSYESIDQIFIDLVKHVLASFEAQVWLMASAVQQKGDYLPGDSRWLIAALPDEIIEMRKYWRGLFGDKQGAVRPEDSFAFVGVVKSG